MSFKNNNILIGQMLLKEGLISDQQLEAGLKEQRETRGFICSVLVRLGFVKEQDALKVLSQQLNVPYVKLKDTKIDSSAIKQIPAKLCSHYKVIPTEYKNNILKVAVTDPLDIHALDEIRLLINKEVKPVLSGEQDILEAIRKYYGIGADTLEKIKAEEEGIMTGVEKVKRIEDLEATADIASIIKFVNQIFLQAVKERATDIHFEPQERKVRVRFRIDGILYDIPIPELTQQFYQAIVSRIKIMAQLDIAEHRLPQDGRIKIRVGENELDLRVSILPSAFGEAVDIRILISLFLLDLDKLGLLPEDLEIMERIIKKPHGIVFVTGPTGSGKSTTLYASLSKINSTQINIITVEDPIEYQLPGITQLQVQPKIGLTFANGLRSILRHDPDVIMVGEVRDYETAEIAIRSALTGHLVFSTLHTNDAAGAVTRLLDMGVEPFLVSSSLECIVAQRLVRLICPECKKIVEPEKKKEMGLFFKDAKVMPADLENAQIYEGRGCEACKFTGYKGRTGIYEILVVTQPIREMILSHCSSQEIKRKAIELGMRTLRMDGIQKVFRGLTTIAEIMRVTQQEEAAS